MYVKTAILMAWLVGSYLGLVWGARVWWQAVPLAISLALVGAIAGEFVSSQVGLGYVILTAQGNFQITRVFAAVVLLGALGTALFYLILLAERLVVPWHVSLRGGHGSGH